MTAVSAVLVVCDELELLPRCLASLTELPTVTEICVLDTGSTDGTRDILAGWRDPVPLVWDQCAPSPSHAYYLNRASELATGDWLLYTDADEAWSVGVGGLLSNLDSASSALLAARFYRPTVYPDWRHSVGPLTVDPQCRLVRRGVAEWRRDCHATPWVGDLHLFTAGPEQGVLCCVPGMPLAHAVLLHGHLLKSPQALAAKGRLWQERGKLAESAREGAPAGEDYWLKLQEQAREMTVAPLPPGMLDPLEAAKK